MPRVYCRPYIGGPSGCGSRPPANCRWSVGAAMRRSLDFAINFGRPKRSVTIAHAPLIEKAHSNCADRYNFTRLSQSPHQTEAAFRPREDRFVPIINCRKWHGLSYIHCNKGKLRVYCKPWKLKLAHLSSYGAVSGCQNASGSSSRSWQYQRCLSACQ
jgi:hypothetical protein